MQDRLAILCGCRVLRFDFPPGHRGINFNPLFGGICEARRADFAEDLLCCSKCNCNLPCPGFRLPTRKVYCSELPRDLTPMTGSFAAAALNNPPARILPLSTTGRR